MLVFLSSANPVFFNHLTVLAVLLLVGLLIGRLCEKIKIASITGYVLSGIIIGMVSVYLDKESVFSNLSILSSIGLGILAFEIGTRLYFKKVAPIALEVVVITVFQTIMVFGLVFLISDSQILKDIYLCIFGLQYFQKYSPQYFQASKD